MHLENISLGHFKNYESLQVPFSSQINCFVGKNGSGKTNLLDAIYLLCMTKSAFSSQDAQVVQHEAPFFSVKGHFQQDGTSQEVLCALQVGKKKMLKLDGVPYKKASEHIGRFPVVLIAPNDTDVIRGGSEERRKFFDATISQVDAGYLQDLIDYGNVLKQRNGLLRQFAERDYFDGDLLDQYDRQLIQIGTRIFEVRSAFITEFQDWLLGHYENLSEGKEQISLNYESHFQEDIADLFQQNRQKDRLLKRTSVGIHRDDYHFIMGDHLIRKFGSQGQQKSYLIAMKLGQFDYLTKKKGVKPLLLLDDIFDKLDDLRIKRLMEMVADETFGQIFLTDARPERTRGIFSDWPQEVKIFEVNNGDLIG